jgi:hypothetical protein
MCQRAHSLFEILLYAVKTWLKNPMVANPWMNVTWSTNCTYICLVIRAPSWRKLRLVGSYMWFLCDGWSSLLVGNLPPTRPEGGLWLKENVPEYAYIHTTLQSNSWDKLPLVEMINWCRRAIVGDNKEQNALFFIVSITAATHILWCRTSLSVPWTYIAQRGARLYLLTVRWGSKVGKLGSRILAVCSYGTLVSNEC